MCYLIKDTACASEIRFTFTRIHCVAFHQTAGSRTNSCGSLSPDSTVSHFTRQQVTEKQLFVSQLSEN